MRISTQVNGKIEMWNFKFTITAFFVNTNEQKVVFFRLIDKSDDKLVNKTAQNDKQIDTNDLKIITAIIKID